MNHHTRCRAGRRRGKLLLVAVALLASSCATMRIAPSNMDVTSLLAKLDLGGYAAGKVVAQAPFLFDGEILALQADVDGVFTAMAASGFRFGDSKVVSSGPLAPDSWNPVSSAMDVSTFVSKRLGPTCTFVVAQAKGGRYFLIFDRGSWNSLRLRGFAGPVK